MTTVNMLEAKSTLSRLVDAIEQGREKEIVIRTGRLFDPVRTGSQQPAALRFRTFNSHLMRGAIPMLPT